MCILGILVNAMPGIPLIVVHNRDERVTRGTERPQHEDPILGARDHVCTSSSPPLSLIVFSLLCRSKEELLQSASIETMVIFSR